MSSAGIAGGMSKSDSGGSDGSAAAPFKFAYSPFTAMAEAASKSSSASSDSAREGRNTDSAQVPDP